MTNGAEARRRFQFGPREQRGLVAGIRTGQVLVVTGGFAGAVALLRTVPGHLGGPLAFLVLVAAVAVACLPVGGRTVEEWFPVAARFGSASLAHGRDGRAGLEADAAHRRPPRPFHGLAVVGVRREEGRELGAVVDGGSGVWTGVLAVSGEAFALLDEGEREQRVEAWSAVLAAVSNGAHPPLSLQWIERTVPDSRAELSGHGRKDAAAPDWLGRARRSYSGFLGAEASGALRHEILFAVSVQGPRHSAGLRSRAAAAASTQLADRVGLLTRRLRAAGIGAEILDSARLRAVVHEAFAVGPTTAPVSWPWPIAVRTSWSELCTDGLWHATYWIAEWPRSDVGSDFLQPLLAGSTDRRTVSLVMAPRTARVASRRAEQARTAGLADAQLRARHGFALTARSRREQDAVVRRAGELAEGHAAYRFSGYLTVTAPDRAALDASCARLEQVGALARLELRRLYGMQSEAFCFGLPAGRGCG